LNFLVFSDVLPTVSFSITKKKSSGVDNWYLVEFFEEFICGRWYIYLEQTIFHLYQPIRCWLSSFTVEYHLLGTIISYVAWYLSPANDIHLKQMILIWRGWYLSRADDIHPMETIFIQKRRILSMILILEITINHWRWYSTTVDHNQPLGW
jgi:hypothetical protein